MTSTLAEIERATARRVGPYYGAALDRQVPSISGLDFAIVPNLRSTMEVDLVTNMWLLRRGLDYQGNPVTVDPLDRQRLVASYDALSGRVIVDRPWSVVPTPGEMVEFHHLDPSMELRTAVRNGLRRCFFEDRFDLGSGYIYEADLTAALPWLIDQRQISRVQTGSPSGGLCGSTCDISYTVFGQSGHVCLRLNSAGCGSFYGSVLVTVYRPHFSWVNSTDALEGPTDDDDVLDVDLNYAAAAAHIEAWHLLPARMAAAAAGGLQATQAMAAQEFTREARIHFPEQPQLLGPTKLSGRSGSSLVINA